MGLWLETIGILLVAVCGLFAGRWACRHSSGARMCAMAAAFGIVALILLARQSVLWSTFPTLCPISAGRLRFVLLAFAVTLGLTTPLGQLHSLISRFATCAIMSVFIAILVTLPFMGPALVQDDLSGLQTTFDKDGICRQSQSFTCGPAAAVTALNHFGIEATEGQLAVASRTSPIIGTSPWTLCHVLQEAYEPMGLQCDFRHLGSLEQIPADSIVLTILEDSMLTDHCVAILGFNDQTVTIADPVDGLVSVPR